MFRFGSSLLAINVIALAVSIAPAHAQQARSFVSGLGSDLNAPNCTRTAPCRTFQTAHNNTIPSGEITVLDAGSYGSLTINRNISIINDGVGEAGALVSGGGVGITISAGPTDRVSLRGLTIKGLDPAFGGSNGIRFNSGGSLIIDNCTITNQTGDGIQLLDAPPANTRVPITISHTFVADNGGNGILVQPSGTGLLDVVLNRVEMYSNSANGFAVTVSGTAVTAVDSVAAHNGSSGFSASHTTLVAKRLVAVYNLGSGLIADGATIMLSEAMATFNSGGDLRCINSGHLASTQDSLFLTTDTIGGCGATGVLVKQ